MNRTVNTIDSLAGASLHRRTTTFDPFSGHRRTSPLPPSDESDVSMKIAKISVVSTKSYGHGGDDLLSFGDGSKHDYDWLLTPPGTPTSSQDHNEPQQPARRSNSLSKSTPTVMKSSRLSGGTRSSSAARPSTTTSTQSNPFSSSRPSPALNMSSVSLSSYLRPSASVSRPSIISSRTTSTRPSTPSKSRPLPGSTDRARPSTPTPRSQCQPSPSSLGAPSNSRPSTPGSRTRVMSNGFNTTPPVSRSNSPSPKPRSPHPPVPHDFPTETPPNLRTTLPDRPLSTGRSRPVASTATVNGGPRRQSSPVVTRGRSVEPVPGKSRGHGNGKVTDLPDGRRVPEAGARKAPTTTAVAVNSGSSFGRNISKKSIDMAVRHMDIRGGTCGGVRQPSGALVFPQSIRPRMQQADGARTPPELSRKVRGPAAVPGGPSPAESRGRRLSREAGGVYESSRYDSILLREDSRNMSWLHNADEDRSDNGVVFDTDGLDLPEPFPPA